MQKLWGLFTSGLALTAPACSNDLDSLFCDPECTPTEAGVEEDDGTPPILPFLPDQGAIEACEECSVAQCKAERDTCLEDDVCTAQLICMGRCDDPGCREECRGAGALDEFSPFYGDLFDCTFRECPAACQERENWRCVDDYRWA